MYAFFYCLPPGMNGRLDIKDQIAINQQLLYAEFSLAADKWQPALYLCVMDAAPVVLFDGVCNFCNRMVNFAIRNDRQGRIRFAALQSGAGQALLKAHGVPPGADTVVLIDKGKVYTYAAAGIRISKYLDWPARIMYAFIIIPPFISEPVYRWFARHRYKWFGKKETCMIPSPEVRSRFLD